MKERILTGWTIKRALYIVIGVYLISQSAMESQWFGVLFGTYFASMGIFRFGCASGNCMDGSCDTQTFDKPKTELIPVELKEAKPE